MNFYFLHLQFLYLLFFICTGTFSEQGWQSKFDEWVEVNSWRLEGHHVFTAVSSRERKLIENKKLKEEQERLHAEQEKQQLTNSMDLMEDESL